MVLVETAQVLEPAPVEVVSLFLGGAEVVAAALADSAVVAAWDRPSVLEHQTVAALAGHLARGGVWVVGEYLEAGPAAGPADFGSAAEYFATLVEEASPDDHRAIRQRGAAAAAAGPEALVQSLDEHLGRLRPRLATLDGDLLVAVVGGRVMRLEDYLVTRIVEQTVHLDDLARSVGRQPWALPPGAEALVLAVGAEIGRRRRGATAMLRALYRRGFSEGAVPVL